MKFSWRTELPPLLLVLFMFGLSAWVWSSTPGQVPVHWGLDGRPDRFGARAEGLLVTPFVGLFLYLLFRAFPALDPGRGSYAGFADAYFAIRLGVIAFVSAVHAMIVLQFRTGRQDLIYLVIPLAGALLFLVGSYLGRLAPNWLMGVRTPWTLSSLSTWTRTNRVAGYVLRVCGALFVLAGLSRRNWAFWIAVCVFVASALFIVVYSYLVWRHAPDKRPPGGPVAPAQG